MPPLPDSPFDVETMEPIEVHPHAIWRDDFEEFGPERWTDGEPDWGAPEPDRSGKFGDGRRLVLDAPDPFPEEEWRCPGRTESWVDQILLEISPDFNAEIKRERRSVSRFLNFSHRPLPPPEPHLSAGQG